MLAAEGRIDESVENEWRSMLLSGMTVDKVDALRTAYRSGGLDAMRARRIDQLKQTLKEGAASTSAWGVATDLSRIYAERKDRDNSLQWLETAIDLREDAAIHLVDEHAYDFLRADPRFQSLVKRVGLDQ